MALEEEAERGNDHRERSTLDHQLARPEGVFPLCGRAYLRARRAYLPCVSDPSKDPESPYDSAAVAPEDRGDPKVVDRWLFRSALVALEIH